MSTSDHHFFVEAADILKLLSPSIKQGMSIKRLFEDLSLDESLLADSAKPIGLSDCWRIMMANQNAVQEESHLMSSRPLKKGTTRLVFSNLQHCETVGDALASIAETYNVIHGGDYNFVRKHGRFLTYQVDDSQFSYTGPPEDFAIEFALIRIHCALSILAGEPLNLLRVATKRRKLPQYNHHLNLFDCKCVTGQPVFELTYDANQLTQPLIHRHEIDVAGNVYDQFLQLLSSHQAAEDEFIPRVTAAIKDCSFHSQLPEQSEVASRLNMSVATLRRKLSAAQSSFRTLTDKIVGEYALHLLEDGLTTREIADRVGYSDERSFKRAFRRWHGVTPTAFIRSRGMDGLNE